MNEKDMFYGMNHVSDRFVEEAEVEVLSHSRKRPGLIFLIAALISMSTIVVFAATTPTSTCAWFFSFFGHDTQQEALLDLTDNQGAILDAGLVEINRSVTHEGYTITLESGLCDGYRALIKCRVDAPESVSLNGIQYGLGVNSFLEGMPGNYSAGSYTGYPLEDEDPNDNSITLLLDIMVHPTADSSFSLADGSQWGVSFSSIDELTDSRGDLVRNTLCEGVWDFKVIFNDDLLVTNSTELLSKPVRCLWNLYIRNWKIPFSAKVFSFELRSLTATIRYQLPWITFYQGVYFDQPIYLVLNDGTKIHAEIKTSIRTDEYGETLCLFDCPVSVDDVAFIEFPGVGQVAISGGNKP